MAFTISVEDNGACRMHPLDVPPVQAAKPGPLRPGAPYPPPFRRGCSATPITPCDGQSHGIVPTPGLEPGASALRGRRDDRLLHVGIVGA